MNLGCFLCKRSGGLGGCWALVLGWVSAEGLDPRRALPLGDPRRAAASGGASKRTQRGWERTLADVLRAACPDGPGSPGWCSALTVAHSDWGLSGVFLWACRVCISPKRWFSARAVQP